MSGSLAASRVGGSDVSGLLFLPPQMQAESIYLALAEQEKKKKKGGHSYKVPNSAYSVKKSCYYEAT